MQFCQTILYTKDMKIAFIGHKRVPSNEGGIERVAERQALGLLALGYEPVLYNRGLAAGRGRAKTYKGMRIVRIPAPKGPAEVPVYSLFATVHAAASGMDVLYYHASGPSNMVRLAKLLGKPAVSMLHGLDSRREKWGRFASWYLAKGEKAAAVKADRCLVLSESMKRMLEEKYGSSGGRIVVTHNSVDIPDASEEAGSIMQSLGLEPGGFIMTAARLVPEKGIHTLIEAFGKCSTGKKLVIAGGDSPGAYAYAEDIRRMAEGDERIIIAGLVDTEPLTELYRGAYAFVLASTLEGMPLSLLEAMASGCCPITSDIPENADVIADAGLTFRAGDAEDLAEKIRAVLDDGELAGELGKRAAERVRRDFTGDTAVRQLDEIFRSLGGKKDGE